MCKYNEAVQLMIVGASVVKIVSPTETRAEFACAITLKTALDKKT